VLALVAIYLVVVESVAQVTPAHVLEHEPLNRARDRNSFEENHNIWMD
jgi:hypothetical protein